jgi:hypothetical protein
MLLGKQFPTFQSIKAHSFAFILFGLLDPEDEGTTTLPHSGNDLPSYAASDISFRCLHFHCFVQDKN